MLKLNPYKIPMILDDLDYMFASFPLCSNTFLCFPTKNPISGVFSARSLPPPPSSVAPATAVRRDVAVLRWCWMVYTMWGPAM